MFKYDYKLDFGHLNTYKQGNKQVHAFTHYPLPSTKMAFFQHERAGTIRAKEAYVREFLRICNVTGLEFFINFKTQIVFCSDMYGFFIFF